MRRRHPAPAAGLLLAMLTWIAPAMAAMDDLPGIWTLSTPGAPRSCRLQLRADGAALGRAVSIPPACRHAFPVLASVRSWSVPDGVHLGLNDDNGVNVLMFEETADGHLQTTGSGTQSTYLLSPLKPRRASAAPAATASAPAVPVAAPAPPRPPITPSAVAGHYAVTRGLRDTGCMVTLDDPGATAASPFKARLAPACRDQGIIIFDPVGWSVRSGHLVLSARKGHTAAFSQDEGGIWFKDPKTGQPLGLKRL